MGIAQGLMVSETVRIKFIPKMILAIKKKTQSVRKRIKRLIATISR